MKKQYIIIFVILLIVIIGVTLGYYQISHKKINNSNSDSNKINSEIKKESKTNTDGCVVCDSEGGLCCPT